MDFYLYTTPFSVYTAGAASRTQTPSRLMAPRTSLFSLCFLLFIGSPLVVGSLFSSI